MEEWQEPRNESERLAKNRRQNLRRKRGKHCLVICSTHCQTMANLLDKTFLFEAIQKCIKMEDR